jgi:hypothetical protein
MLTHIREKHTKQILWAITVIILVTFGLGGAVSYIKGRQNPAIGKIGNKKIYAIDADYYDKMNKAAKTLLIFNVKAPVVKSLDALREPGEYLLLVWKANQEKITVSDKEIAGVIKAWFANNGKFNKEAYDRFLNFGIHLQPSQFEGYISNFIKIDKLYAKFAAAKTTEEDVKNAFIRDTQKAKLGYLLFSQESYMSTSASPADKDIATFYEENKISFVKDDKPLPLIDAKADIIESLRQRDARMRLNVDADAVLTDIKAGKIKSLKDLKLKKGIEYIETNEFRHSDYIEGVGLDLRFSGIAFSLNDGQIHPEVLNLPKGAYIIQLLSKSAFDADKFAKTKEEYRKYLDQQNAAQAQADLFEKIKEESKFEIFETPQKGKVPVQK